MRNISMSHRLGKHFEGVVPATLLVLFMASIVWVADIAVSYVFQKYSPASYWFEYGTPAVTPIKNEFTRNEPILFQSNSEYKRPIQMEWQDTLYCRVSGSIDELKLGTQIWKEFTNPKITLPSENWAWGMKRVPDWYDECYLYSVVIGTTEMGFKKVFTNRTNWFVIK